MFYLLTDSLKQPKEEPYILNDNHPTASPDLSSSERFIYTSIKGASPQTTTHESSVEKDDKETLILLHGLSGSHLNWKKLTQALQPHMQTIAFDFIGHARSSAPTTPESYQLEAVMDDIDQIISKHTNGKALLAGLSMGAAAMLQFALRYPEKVSGLILTSFPPPKHEGGISAIAPEFADAILSKGLEAAGEQFVWGNSGLFSDQDAKMIQYGFKMHPSPHGLAFCMKEFLAKLPDQSELLKEVSSSSSFIMPVLLIAGECDLPSLKATKALAEAIPEQQCSVEIIKKGGHLVNLDSVNAYNATIITFLTELGAIHS